MRHMLLAPEQLYSPSKGDRMMEKFAFVIHPLRAKDASKRFPPARYLPNWSIEHLMLRKKPEVVASITGIRSATGAGAKGWFVGCPLTPRLFMKLPYPQVLEKLKACVDLAAEKGARIIGLGAYSSIAGDGGIELEQYAREKHGMAVTTGNSYTTATAIEAAWKGALLMGIDPAYARFAVLGATGSIGQACAEVLAIDKKVRDMTLIGRNTARLYELRERLCKGAAQAVIGTDDNVLRGLLTVDVIIAVSSAIDAIVKPHDVKRGAVVVDVARPRDVSEQVARVRKDVLIIEGGVVRVPGAMVCNDTRTGDTFSFGFPPWTAYACMAETMALALEGRYESFTIGKTVSAVQVREISELCMRQGFHLDGFRSFGRALTDTDVAYARFHAGR